MLPHLTDIFNTAVRSVTPSALIPPFLRMENNRIRIGDTSLDPDHTGRIVLAGAGKAAADMALTVEEILGNRIDTGIVVTKYGHTVPLRIVECIEAGHPLPDDHSLIAGERIIRLLEPLSDQDVLIFLLSGGASSLLFDVPPGCSFEEIQALINRLMRSGAGIHDMNTVRKHLSVNIKGGQLARIAFPAKVCNLVLSDVPGDDLGTIASGPVSPDPTTFADAWQILEKYGQAEKLSQGLIDYFTAGRAGRVAETPKEDDPVFSQVESYIIGNNTHCLEKAAERATELGYETVTLPGYLEGEASRKARDFAQLLLQKHPRHPLCLIAGGETTVTVNGKGKGGRNQEFALAALDELYKTRKGEGISLLSAGTDGTDGPTDATGALFDNKAIERVHSMHLDPAAFLADNDAYSFFERLGNLLITGPTHTNVMDIVIALIRPSS